MDDLWLLIFLKEWLIFFHVVDDREAALEFFQTVDLIFVRFKPIVDVL